MLKTTFRKKLKKGLIIGIVFNLFHIISVYAQDLPIGYVSYFSDKANNQLFINKISSCTPEHWNISKDKSCTILYPVKADSLQPCSVCLMTGIIANMIFGEYIMEFDFYPANNPKPDSSGFCFISPVKSSDTYYACVFERDSVSFYYINKNIPEKTGSKVYFPILNKWNHIRVTRDILKRSISFVFNNDAETRITFSDPRLVMGFVGFGTWETESKIKNINIWAPTVITDSTYLCK